MNTPALHFKKVYVHSMQAAYRFVKQKCASNLTTKKKNVQENIILQIKWERFFDFIQQVHNADYQILLYYAVCKLYTFGKNILRIGYFWAVKLFL